MTIRLAGVQDAPALLDIYAKYIDTSITFEYILPSREEFAGRIASISRDYPYLVCEEEGRVLGYAYAHYPWERAAYQWNAELSIYLDPAATGRGLGKKLYALLEELLRLQGINTLYGVVAMPNGRSEGLHRAMGFTCQCVFPKAGFKAGDWRDVAWFRKELSPPAQEPAPLIPFHQLPEEAVRAVLKKYN